MIPNAELDGVAMTATRWVPAATLAAARDAVADLVALHVDGEPLPRTSTAHPANMRRVVESLARVSDSTVTLADAWTGYRATLARLEEAP